jgi:hypothetical protein
METPEIIRPSGEIVPGTALVPYVHPTLTNKSPVVWPLLLTAITGWAILMVDWGTMRWMDHAPDWAWIASTIIAVCVLAVVQNREWLNFRGRRYFPFILTCLMLAWVGVVGVAYYEVKNSPEPIDPAVAQIQLQLATALRQRDAAIVERDAARLETGKDQQAPKQPAPAPVLKYGDAEARIDAWKTVVGQMNELSHVLGDADKIADNWKDSATFPGRVINLRNSFETIRGRLGTLVGSYPEFSDLKTINLDAMLKLSRSLANLVQAVSPPPTDFESSIGPYIGPLKRELAPTRQWMETTKNLANSSISEIIASQMAK